MTGDDATLMHNGIARRGRDNFPTSESVGEQIQGPDPLDASRLTYTFIQVPRAIPKPDSAELWAQGEATDHMILAYYDYSNRGWAAPQLVPYGPLSLMPTAATLHYATECFEGLKLYRGVDGRVRLFRPELNAQRMRDSAARVSLPDFPAEQLVRLIAAIAAIDAPRWLPKNKQGAYLYVRPTFIATQPSLAIKKASEALLYIMLVCFPDFDQPTGSLGPPMANNKPSSGRQRRAGLRLLSSDKDMMRAWPGGFGNHKVGANYGPSIVASAAAARQEFDQILWLFGSEEWITEAGACNFFALVKAECGTGKAELLTAPLGQGVILPGVTRASVLEVASAVYPGELKVVERNYSIHELIEAANDGSLIECFVCGTAFFIAPVGEISYKGKIFEVPVADQLGESNGIVERLRVKLWAIMHGEIDHPWGYVVEESGVPESQA